MRVISHFSCGVASAVATKLALLDHPDLIICNMEIKEEHPDNKRFLKDCEKWFGKEILILGNDKYERSIYKVFEKQRYLSGVAGAPCTRLLKRKVREDFEEEGDINVFGYSVEEQHRLDRLIDANNHVQFIAPLIDRGLTKQDCLAMVQDAGIELPMQYKLGFKNNNCLGCVKASGHGYWLLVKKHHREMFDRMSKAERDIGAKLLKRTENGKTIRYQLHEIPEYAKPMDDSIDIQCGIFCQLAEQEYK